VSERSTSENSSSAWSCPFPTGFVFAPLLSVLVDLKKRMHENIAVTLSHASTVVADQVSEEDTWAQGLQGLLGGPLRKEGTHPP